MFDRLGASLLVGILAGLAAGALWGLVFVAPAWAPGLVPVDMAAALGLGVLGFSGYYFFLVHGLLGYVCGAELGLAHAPP